MVVVADTSPINYLVLIARIDLLTRLYTRILIPPAVLVRDWVDNAPRWLEVQSPKCSLILPKLDFVLDEADQAGLVNFEDAVAELRKTSFRVSQAVLAAIRQK